MIKITGIKVPKDSSIEHVKDKAAHMLRIDTDEIKAFKVLKRSTDARKKNSILDVYTVAAGVTDEKRLLKKIGNKDITLLTEKSYSFPERPASDKRQRPVIAGFGPAGIFTGLILAHAGYRPVIYERGRRIEDRAEDVARFFDTGVLDPDSNVQFGEGGAGTFSDGKLNSGIKDREGRKEFVLETLVRHGADSSILTDSHPHIGTDRLLKVIPSIRSEIEALGGEIHFESRLSDLSIADGRLTGIMVSGTEEYMTDCDSLFLCLGHSARDTFFMLYEKGFKMEAKSFAVGVRAEHRRKMIDEALHQESASYKLTYHCGDGRGVYSFCMCPGGYVVNASSEEGFLTVNGMSYSGRDGINSNAAIVCTVSPEDYSSDISSPLAGIAFQRELEKKAFQECSGQIPYQRFIDFKLNRVSEKFEAVKPCCKGSAGYGNLRNVLPSFISDDIIEAMPAFAEKIAGYDSDDTLFAGIEARTSSPVRILRDDNMQSESAVGIYPVGEGAGYAGGIMSAAIDGMKAAECYIKQSG